MFAAVDGGDGTVSILFKQMSLLDSVLHISPTWRRRSSVNGDGLRSPLLVSGSLT